MGDKNIDMIMGIRKEMVEQKEKNRAEKEEIIEEGVRVGKERWKIIGVYVKENIDEILTSLEKWMKENKEDVNVLMEGDFNARTGKEGRGQKKEEKTIGQERGKVET